MAATHEFAKRKRNGFGSVGSGRWLAHGAILTRMTNRFQLKTWSSRQVTGWPRGCGVCYTWLNALRNRAPVHPRHIRWSIR